MKPGNAPRSFYGDQIQNIYTRYDHIAVQTKMTSY